MEEQTPGPNAQDSPLQGGDLSLSVELQFTRGVIIMTCRVFNCTSHDRSHQALIWDLLLQAHPAFGVVWFAA
jgi:hypothetical protein